MKCTGASMTLQCINPGRTSYCVTSSARSRAKIGSCSISFYLEEGMLCPWFPDPCPERFASAEAYRRPGHRIGTAQVAADAAATQAPDPEFRRPCYVLLPTPQTQQPDLSSPHLVLS